MEQIETAGGSEAIFELINIIRQDPSIWDRTSATYITHFDLKIHRFAEIAEQLNLESGWYIFRFFFADLLNQF